MRGYSETRTLKQRKQDLQDFANLFCKIYKISEPELRFEEKEMIAQFHPTGVYNDGKFEIKGVIDINEQFLQNSADDLWNNFGILFHELMHARQFRWGLSLDEKYYPFTKVCDFSNDFTSYDKAFDLEVYRLKPKEGHAYYMQWKFNEQCNERIFKGKEKQNALVAPFARALWYDYQSR